MISPYKIKWLGETSLEYDCWTELAFDGDSGDVDSHFGREAIISEAYNGTLKRTHGYKWNNDFTPTITFIKQDYSDFTAEENHKMLKWLTKSPNASFLNIYKDDSEAVEYAILGNFINVSQYKMGNGRIVGYICEFESVTPWAFSELYTITKDTSGQKNNTFTISLNTDEPQSPVYPRLIIQQNSNTSVVDIGHAMTNQDEWLKGTVYHYNGLYYWIDSKGTKHTSTTNDSGIDTSSVVITNTHTDEIGNITTVVTKVINNIKGETVVLDGANQVVSSSRMNGRIFGQDFNWKWLPLFEGQNTISIIGNCTISIQYREPIKCGEH